MSNLSPPGQLFLDNITTIRANWLNDVNNAVYNSVWPTGALASSIIAGTNVSIVSGTNGTITISASGGGSVTITGNGLVSNNSGTLTGVVLTGTNNQITVTNGDGIAGAPTVAISSSYPATLTLTESQITNLVSDLAAKQASNAHLTTLATNSITGTSNQIDVSATYQLSIDSGYVGQTSLTTLGTVTTGAWNATPITAQYGGIGGNNSTAANGTIPIGNGSGFTVATLTAGTNVTITNNSGTITIASTGGGGSSQWGYPDLVSYTYCGGL